MLFCAQSKKSELIHTQINLNQRLRSHTPRACLNKAPALWLIAAAMGISDTAVHTLIKFRAFD
jgi:hypothetical protein